MTEKERLLELIYKIDDALNETLSTQKELHLRAILLGSSMTRENWETLKKCDAIIEEWKSKRKFCQEILFAKYQTVVPAEWQEAEP